VLDDPAAYGVAAELAFDNLRLNRTDLLHHYGYEVGPAPHLAIMSEHARRLRAAGDLAAAAICQERVADLRGSGMSGEQASARQWHPGPWRWRGDDS
jgi:hypothetical protein